MSRKSERELTFKLLYMSNFYEEKDLTEELLLYFDAPYPYPENDDENIIDFSSLKNSMKDVERQKVVAKYVEVLEKVPEIDQKISEVSKGWTIDRMGKVELAILRLALFEILFDDEVPTGVAINEAVELAKKFGPEESYAFVNGVLAKFA